MKRATLLVTGIFAWLRRYCRTEDAFGQTVIVLAVIFISIRIIFPVRHLADGFVLYLYPFREFNVCEIDQECGIDRSRTAVQSGSIALLATGLLYVRHQRRK